jgi:hypothetical protein
VTAFTIESYKWLNESNDATARLLAQLLQHLGTANVTVSETPFVVTAAAVRINVFWFLSLIIALSSALIGILCKQWIREYQRDPRISNQEAFELRQLRHQSWEAWRVPDIISSTSFLLQLALLLFFAGITDLLWSRVHVPTVAVVVTVAVGLSALFILLTIILPTCYDLFQVILPNPHTVEWVKLIPCAYRSPLSRVLLSLSRYMTHWCRLTEQGVAGGDKFGSTSDWSSVDLQLLRYYKTLDRQFPIDHLHQGMKWAVSALGDNVATLKHLFRCIESSSQIGASLAPYAFDCNPPDDWPYDTARDYAYVQFLQDRGFGREMPLLYIEATLCCIDNEPLISSKPWYWCSILAPRLSQIHDDQLPQG